MIINRYSSGREDFCCLIVLDRDNTLILDNGYTHQIADLKILPGVIDGLRTAVEHGSKLAIVTNQGGIGLKKYTREQYKAFNSEMVKRFQAEGVSFDLIVACPHHPNSPHSIMQMCKCRKPGTKMLETAIKYFGMGQRVERVLVIGDSASDLLMAKSLSVPSSLVNGDLDATVGKWIASHNS